MKVKLGDLIVKRKGGTKEVEFVVFLMQLLEILHTRAQVKKMIKLVEEFDTAWLDQILGDYDTDETDFLAR